MSYKYKCPNCKRTTDKKNKKVLVVCGCGYQMVLVTLKESFKTELKGGTK